MKLEVGMYARTINGKIWIIISQKAISGHRKDIIKASHNIMDLIEVGDYVNGLLVTRICEDNETKEKYINLYGSVSKWEQEDIKSIVTKEQFESIKYSLEG